MINQREWLQTRKNLLDQVKSQVRVRLGPMSPGLRRYAKNLDADFRAGWKACSAQDFNKALKKANVILSADFHAYAQSQRAHLRLVRDHISNSKVILALECLSDGRDQEIADFIKGRISETEFLRAVEWDKNWGFPWEHYRPLFELARDRGFQIIGINHKSGHSLSKRDEWAARRILKAHDQNPSALIYVVVGEWHLAKSHLPKLLLRKFRAPGQMMIVHQDVEPLYFKMARTNRENSVEFLKGPDSRFCMMVSPPWMKWQSYLMYLEQTYDRDLQEDLAVDYSDHVASLVQILEKDLKIETSKAHLQVYCSNSKTSLARLRMSLTAKQEKAFMHYLEHDQSFLIPQKGWMYLSRATINHASTMAGQFVHAQLSNRSRTLWNMPGDFLPLIWVEAVGFFFSKWINPKRKAESLDSIRMQLQSRGKKDRGAGALLLALDYRLSEVLLSKTGRLRRAQYRPPSTTDYYDAARIVGSMVGERLFQKVRSKTISLKRLMSYLKMNVDKPDFSKFYWKLIREIGPEKPL